MKEKKTISPMAVEALKSALISGNVFLMDIRDVRDYKLGHISGAVSLPLQQLDIRITGLLVERAQQGGQYLVVIAADDPESLKAIQLLNDIGVPVQHYLEGGMTAWLEAGEDVAE